MSKLNFFVLVVAICAVLYFIITKADTALSKGQGALKQQVVTPEEDAQNIMDDADLR